MAMRQLTPNEKRLSWVLAASVFIIVNLVGISFYMGRARAMQAEIAALRNQRTEAEVWMADREFWEARAAWLKEHQPPRPSGSDASSELLQEIQRSTNAAGLTILTQSLQDPNPQPGYYEVAIRLQLSGSLESLVKWLAQLQKPTAFYAIPSFNLKSDKEPPNVICDLVVARWHAPSTP